MLEMNTEVSTTSTGDSSSSSGAAPSPAQSTTVASPVTPSPASLEGGEATPPAYVPNFKYKVMNEEREIDENLRAVIKDAETEKKVRELHEKAFGLDHFKSKHTKLQDDFKALEGKYQPLSKNLQNLSAHLNMGDFGTFFQKIGVPKANVFQWVLNELQQAELPPQQRQVAQEAMEAKRRAFELEQELNETKGQTFEAQVQARTVQLNTALAKPEIQPVAQAFDARRGENAFHDFVVKYAAAHYHQTGEDMSVEQAVSECLGILGHQSSGGQQAAPAPMPNAQASAQGNPQVQQGTPVVQAKPPVIPNVSGKNTSPTKRLPRSIDDLKKLGQGQTLG